MYIMWAESGVRILQGTRAVTRGIGGYNWGNGCYEGGIGDTDITGLEIRGVRRVESGDRILRGQ